MAAHPLLMETATPTAQSKKERYKPMVPKFSTTKVRFPYLTCAPNDADLARAGQRSSPSPTSKARSCTCHPRSRIDRRHSLL